MKEALQRHSLAHLSEYGYELRRICSAGEQTSRIHYAHRDDYFMFGLILQGTLKCSIDFNEYTILSGCIAVISPGQVHKFISDNGIEAYMLLVDPGFLDYRLLQAFDYIALSPTPFFEAGDYSDLKILFEMMSRHEDAPVGRRLALAAMEIIARKVSDKTSQDITGTDRKRELMFNFRNLLRESIKKERRPAYYADRLNISRVYLNEIVHTLSGQSASRYIINEIILMAKRELYYTTKSIKEIAARLGFNDSAYFTRLFSETAGATPSEFRRNLV